MNLDNEGNAAAGRDDLTALVTELRAAIRDANPDYSLSFDLGISPNGQAAGYDHKALAAQLDFTLPRAYDECWGAKKGTANSDISTAIAGIKQYSQLGIAPESLVIGFPWYGWDFPCTDGEMGGACAVVPGTTRTRQLEPEGAFRGLKRFEGFAKTVKIELLSKTIKKQIQELNVA